MAVTGPRTTHGPRLENDSYGAPHESRESENIRCPQADRHLLVGREWSWPPAFLEEVNRRDVGVIAEFVTLGAPTLDETIPWDVVIDRISHEVPFYRTWLKHAALAGVTVINNPFMWTADDKFFGATLAEANGHSLAEDRDPAEQDVCARHQA